MERLTIARRKPQSPFAISLLLTLIGQPLHADQPLTILPADLHVRVAPCMGYRRSQSAVTRPRAFSRSGGPVSKRMLPLQKSFDQFAAAGTPLFCLNANAAACDYGHSSPVWTATDTWDYTRLDERIADRAQASPTAMIMPRVNMGTPRWWLEQSPEEHELLDHGSAFYRQPNRNPTLPPDRAFPSCASTKWRNDIGRGAASADYHIQSSDYADHIFGYILTGIDTEESYHWSSGSNQLAGYSPPTRAAFREWLRRKYGRQANLQRAWQRPEITFAEVEIPTVRNASTARQAPSVIRLARWT